MASKSASGGGVRAKKHLGQHFLTDRTTAERIVHALRPELGYQSVLEVGPGMGILSDFLLEDTRFQTWMVDVDEESIDYLRSRYPDLGSRLIHGDFLKLGFGTLFAGEIAVIGNFPYHISSQIVFKLLEERSRVPEIVGMFQKEVAERCAAGPGTKAYGILSVLTQAYYQVEYLFTVKAGAFNPPPKVLSGVIRLSRHVQQRLDCDEDLFRKVVKAAFNQRRKTLRNALSGVLPKDRMDEDATWDLRAERLSVSDFVSLTNRIASLRK